MRTLSDPRSPVLLPDAVDVSADCRMTLDQRDDGSWSLALSGDFTGCGWVSVLNCMAARVAGCHHPVHVRAVDVVEINEAAAQMLRTLEACPWPPVVVDAISPVVAQRIAELAAPQRGRANGVNPAVTEADRHERGT